MSDRGGCAAVVLAAGASIRLGQPKQLLQIEGETLLHRTLRLAREAGCSPILAVLGFDAERMKEELIGTGAQACINPDWPSGMASSLRCGIEVLIRKDPVPARTLLLVCDQPKLSTKILSRLMQSSMETSPLITASGYAGKLGVPAIFGAQLYSELLQVEGDQGARSVIQRYVNQTTSVEFPGGIIDIDTPEDVANLASRR